MTFGEAIQTCFSKYVEFNGRASRSEYWWFFLVSVLAYLGIVVIAVAVAAPILILAAFGLLLPQISAAVRRLHDTGKSGGWYFISFVPYLGGIVLLIMLAQPSQSFANSYGPATGSASANGFAPMASTPMGEITWQASGQRYLLGIGDARLAPYYGIWDRLAPGSPIARYPYLELGKSEAVAHFARLEPGIPLGIPASQPPAPPMPTVGPPNATGFGQPYSSGHAI